MPLVARELPVAYVERLLAVAADRLEHGPRLEWGLRWIKETLGAHGRWVRERGVELASTLRAVRRAIGEYEGAVAKLWVSILSLFPSAWR